MRDFHPAQTSPNKPSRGAIPFSERPTCTIAEACEATGLGRSKLYQLMTSGSLDTTRVGRRRLVRVESLLRILTAE